MLNVLTAYNDAEMGAVAYHRLFSPLQQLSLDGHIKLHQIVSWDAPLNELLPIIERMDVVYISRTINSDNELELIAHIKNHCKLIVDLDDTWVLPNTHIIFKQYRENRMTERTRNLIRVADAVTVTTDYLAAKVAKINKKVAILKNSLNPRHPQWQTPKTPFDVPRIMWAGGNTHEFDLMLVEQAMGKLAFSDIPHHVIHGGYRDQPIYKAYAYLLSGQGKSKNFSVLEKADVFGYGTFYDHCEIAIAPLTVSEFNKCKSELKAIEAGTKWCAFIGSANSPYEYVIDKNTGILVSNKHDWFKAITSLLKDPDRRDTLAAGLNHAISEHYDFDTINGYRLHVINSI
jgi:glycosyltransferase involved in cell wall biosynthesis